VSLAANGAAILNGSTGILDANGSTLRGWLFGWNDRTIDVTLSGTTFCNYVQTNAGASGEVIITLPTASTAYHIIFIVDAAQYLRVKAATGDLIRGDLAQDGTIVSSAVAGYWRSNEPGAFLKLIAISATTWQVVGIGGTWTVDS
jgi:hypothetical protein